MLDYLLGSGDEAITYRKAELKTFVALGLEDKLADDELGLLGSVLEFSEKTVSAIMVSRASTRWLTDRHPLKTCTAYRLNGSWYVYRYNQELKVRMKSW